MKIKLILILVFLTPKVFFAGNHDMSLVSGNIIVSYSLFKNEYLQLEPIRIAIKVKNIGISLDSIDIVGTIDFMCRSSVFDSSEKKVEYKGGFLDRGNNFIKLSPDQELNYAGDISENFGDIQIMSNQYPYYYFSEGSYKFKADYGNITGIHNLCEVTFKVIKPYGIEYEVFEKVINISGYPDSLRLKYEALLHNYPKNVYTDQVFFYYSKLSKTLNENYVDQCRWFFEVCPDSYYVDYILKYCSDVIKLHFENPTDTINDFLNELIKKHPGTRIQQSAEYYLKSGSLTK